MAKKLPKRSAKKKAKPDTTHTGFGVDPNRAVLPIKGYRAPKRKT